MVDQLAQDYGDRFAPLTMHVNNDGYDVPWGQHRLDAFYGLAGASPVFMVGASWNCPATDYRYCVQQELGIPTDTSLDLSASPAGGSAWDITARVCLERGNPRPMKVYTAATLDQRPGLQNYSTNVLMQNVMESDIHLSVGDCENVTSRINFDAISVANSSNIVIIAWAQLPSATGPTTVYQAGIMRWPFPAGSQLTTIEVTPFDANLAIGEEIEFVATGKDQSGSIIALENPTWSLGSTGLGSGTFDPGVGSDTTIFTATTAGSRQVFCTENGVTGGAIIAITEPPQLTDIEIEPTSTTVDVDGQIVFSAMGVDQYGEAFPLTDPVWSIAGVGDGSFDTTTASTTSFTASYPGSAVVTCTQDGVSGTADVEIAGDTPRLATIELSPTDARLRIGEEIEFTATGSDQYGRAFDLVDPTWRAEGDGDGTFEPADGGQTTTFTATTAGSAEIICSDDGIEGNAALTIETRGLPAPRNANRRVTP